MSVHLGQIGLFRSRSDHHSSVEAACGDVRAMGTDEPVRVRMQKEACQNDEID
jgi:hypothetical protein